MRTDSLPVKFLSFAILATPYAVAADEPMRCGKWVVTSQATAAEIVSKCGEPTSKDVSTQDVYGPGPVAGRTHKVGVTTTERWSYDRGSQAFRMIVTIIDGKTISIERAG